MLYAHRREGGVVLLLRLCIVSSILDFLSLFAHVKPEEEEEEESDPFSSTTHSRDPAAENQIQCRHWFYCKNFVRCRQVLLRSISAPVRFISRHCLSCDLWGCWQETICAALCVCSIRFESFPLCKQLRQQEKHPVLHFFFFLPCVLGPNYPEN